MARLLGERILPENVNQRRRSLRRRIREMREPVRQRREGMVPGPDLIGRAEGTLSKGRARFVDRDAVLDRLAGAMPGSDNGGEEQSEENAEEEEAEDGNPSFSV